LALLGGFFPRNSRRGLTACIPALMRPRNIGRGRTLGVTVLAVVKTVIGRGWHTERGAVAITLYVSAAAKWTRIKFDVAHVTAAVNSNDRPTQTKSCLF
jgi:hypothetical protein